MIDVCFGDSEAGEIKFNLFKIQRETTSQDIDNFRQAAGEGNKVVDLFFSNETGQYCHSKQICYLNILFDIGDISGDNVFEKQLDRTLEGWDFRNKKERDEYRKKLLRRYNRIISAAKKGETVRLWHYDSPHSWCGYYFILSQIKAYKPTVISLYMPNEDSQSYFNHCNSWLGDFKQNFLKAAKVMSQEEIEEESRKWDRLVADNKTLRVGGPNGILSVDDNYFDKYILEHIPNGEFKMTVLVGAVLGEYKISESFIEQRIHKFIDDGILEITGHYNTRGDYFNPDYHCYLRRIIGEDERKAIFDYETKENKIIDVIAGNKQSLRAYLFEAKRAKEKYEDLRFSMTEYTSEGGKETECVMSAENILLLRQESRKELFENFKDNKYFDSRLVDKMLSFDNEFCVMDLNLALSDISDEKFYDGRLAYVHNQIVIYLGGEESEAKEIVDNQLKLVDKIVEYAKNGYTLRFWCSRNNEDICSLYYLMNRLRGIECPILLLDLPRRIRKPNGRFIDNLRSWGQLGREQIGFAISQCNPRIITAEEKEKYAQRWDRLKEENSKIRITCGNGIKSVPIDYYFRIIERICPKDKPFKLTSLLRLINKEEKRRSLDDFPYYFWTTQFYIMIDRGILRKVKEIDNDFWGYNCWVEFPTVMDKEEDAFDISDHNLRKYKYTYCSKCGQLVDKTDYGERKYCRYCENPSKDTFTVIGKIYEKAKYVMNYLLNINVAEDIIKLAIADKNLDKSYQVIINNEKINAEDFIKEAGI